MRAWLRRLWPAFEKWARDLEIFGGHSERERRVMRRHRANIARPAA